MERIELEVAPRTETGKGPNRRLRAAGRIPAVVYGADLNPAKVSVDAHTFTRLMDKGRVENALINLVRSSGTKGSDDVVAVVREVQRDPLTRAILHIDLNSIRMDTETEFDLQIHHSGNPVGVKDGGILETHRHTLAVRCLPAAFPGQITVDLSALKINGAVYARDIPLPDGVRLMDEPDTLFYTVAPPKTEAAPAAAEGEEPTQPEVIGKKKEDEA